MSAHEGIDRPASAAVPLSDAPQPQAGPSKPRRRFVGTTNSKAPIRRVANQIPDEILNDAKLNAAIAGNYKFEIHKTIHHIRRDGIKTVALQMPEGLMVYGCAIADIVEDFTGALPLLLADVTYGACCIDDFTAREMGAEMIVHYGHSCLIPVSQVSIKTLYVFVEIGIDNIHLSASVRRNFPSNREAFRKVVLGAERGQVGGAVPVQMELPSPQVDKQGVEGEGDPGISDKTKLALVSTIQFVAAAQSLKENLSAELPELEVDKDKDGAALVKPQDIFWRGAYDIVVPQSRPLSPGEVLGCTAPKLADDVDALIYVGDGRFHLESIMIANPSVPAFRYDPYSKKFTREVYEHGEMRMVRGEAVRKAREALDAPLPEPSGDERVKGAGGWGVVLGTLGRQGSLSVLKTIQASLPESDIPPYMLLLSELSPLKLALLPQLSVFVQTSCPRLSIDWGYAFDRPLLSPYEASVALGRIKGWEGLKVDKLERGEGGYPMDFYADKSLGPWTPRYTEEKPKVDRVRRVLAA